MTKLMETIIQMWYRDFKIMENCEITVRIYAKTSKGNVKVKRPYHLLQ